MNDWVFYLIAIVAVFFLWLYSGGPNNPISFAGPYITPVTGVGQTQIGYRDKSFPFINAGSVISSSHSSASAGIASKPAAASSSRSPYAGEVIFDTSNPEESDAASEYMLISSEAESGVSITGWSMVGARSGTRVTLGDGLPGSSSSYQPILLSPGQNAVLISGSRAPGDTERSIFPADWHVYSNRQDQIWDDGGDTITLLDANGKLVDQYTY